MKGLNIRKALCGNFGIGTKLRRDTLKQTGNHFQIDNDSTVSSVIERMKRKLAGDRKLRIKAEWVQSYLCFRYKGLSATNLKQDKNRVSKVKKNYRCYNLRETRFL